MLEKLHLPSPTNQSAGESRRRLLLGDLLASIDSNLWELSAAGPRRPF